MSTKIGIITIHNSPNYGACLQSFALFQYLQNQGYECEIIDLARPTHTDFIRSEKYKVLIENKKKSLVERLRSKFQSLTIEKIKHIFLKKTNYSIELVLRKQKFDNFNNQIKLSQRFRGIDDLYKKPPEYDIYLTGSDQVWNPGNGYAVEPYFLTFVNNGGKKIAYAPSFGITKLPEFIQQQYRQWLSSYNHISVREEEGKKLLDDIQVKNVEQVLDPVFLLNTSYWKSIAKKPSIGKKYVFCFTLGKNVCLFDYAQQIKEELGYELIVITQNLIDTKSNHFQYIVSSGPEDFLGWIENAEIVLTDSFHATAFSVMLAKNFFSFLLPNKRGNRITNLLNVFSLQEHLLNSKLTQSGKELSNHKIVREDIDKMIIIEQKKSINFLLNAISK